VKQLCQQQQYLKAASHLLSLSRLHEAVGLLRDHKLYRCTAGRLHFLKGPMNIIASFPLYSSFFILSSFGHKLSTQSVFLLFLLHYLSSHERDYKRNVTAFLR